MVKLNKCKFSVINILLITFFVNSLLLINSTTLLAANDCAKTAYENASGSSSTTRECTPSEQAAYDAGIAAKAKEDAKQKAIDDCKQRETSGGGDNGARANTTPCNDTDYANITKIKQEAEALRNEALRLAPLATPPPAESQTDCRPPGIGWLLCPVMRFTGSLVDAAYEAISDMLTTPAVNTDINDNKNSLYKTWSSMRSIANVIFVIAFITIIFSQITNIGLTNYGLKKLLPKLIIAAILVNLSYFICAIAVDVSNIIGFSIRGVFESALNAGGVGKVGKLEDIIHGVLSGVGTVSILSGVAGVAAITVNFANGWVAALTFLVPGLIAAFLAIVTVFVVLAMRQAIIVLLIAVSPIAFVLYLLPNTESWFKKWKDTFVTMLMMFPIISAIFGASELAAYTIIRSSSDIIVQLMGVFIQFIPLAITPLVMKTAGGVLNKVGAFVNNPNRGPFDMMKKGAAGYRERKIDERISQNMAGKGGQLGRFTRWSAKNRNLNDNAKQNANEARMDYINQTLRSDPEYLNQITGGSEDKKMKIIAKLDAEQLKNELQSLGREIATAELNGVKPKDFLFTRATSNTHSSSEKAAAMHYAASSGMDDTMRKINTSIQSSNPGPESDIDKIAFKEAVTGNIGALINKAPDIIKTPDVAFSDVNGEQLSKFSTGTVTAYMDHIKSLYDKANSATSTADDQDNLANAVNSFNSAVEDITLNTSLQASFQREAGKKISSTVSSFTSSNPGFNTYINNNMHGLSAIQSDGKIR